ARAPLPLRRCAVRSFFGSPAGGPAEPRPRGAVPLNSHADSTLESRTGQSDVDMRPGSPAGDGLTERDVRHVQTLEKADQPAAFGLVGIERHVEAVAMIEAHAATDRGFAAGAHRQRP